MNKPEGFNPPLSNKDHKRVGNTLRWLADQMGLADWTIVLEYTPDTNEDVYASVSIPDGRRIAHVSLCTNWRDCTGRERALALVHELVHCHLHQAWWTMGEMVNQLSPPSTAPLHRSLLLAENETLADNIAVAILAMVGRDEVIRRLTPKKG